MEMKKGGKTEWNGSEMPKCGIIYYLSDNTDRKLKSHTGLDSSKGIHRHTNRHIDQVNYT